MEIHFIFQIIVLVISIMAHEVAHGAAAYAFGDQTARNQGRLTLNPLKHIDLFGSIILPLILILTKAGFIFGWAKPVPYNPYNLRHRRLGEFCVSIAGIVTNFTIAIFFSVIIHYAGVLNISNQAVDIILYIILINVILAVFNLFPIPPLDGSKILFTLLPCRYERHLAVFERYGFYLLIIFILFFGPVINQVVKFFLTLLLP
jgi:Zn-dependent protease